MRADAQFERLGAQHFVSALNPADVARVAALFGHESIAGRRMGAADVARISDLLAHDGAIGHFAVSLIGDAARPVRALLFNKSPDANWRLGWHQDRVIAVQERVDVEGFAGWSVKAGQVHVQPPHELIARMVTLRVHVDAVGQNNAPLQILAGSHLLGRLKESSVEEVAREARVITCFATSGDIWAYRTAIVHASAEQVRPGRRRVLQVDYSPDALPGGLEWQYLV
jgi:hypothetical protein